MMFFITSGPSVSKTRKKKFAKRCATKDMCVHKGDTLS